MKTADLVDESGEEVTFCNRPFVMLGRKRRLSEPIATVKCFEDNSLLKATLQRPGEGRVPVVDACFRPGSWVYADRDGVLVTARKLA